MVMGLGGMCVCPRFLPAQERRRGRGLCLGEGLGVTDVGIRFAYEAHGGLDGFAEPHVEAVAMQHGLPLEVAALQSAHCGVGFAYDEEGPGGGGRGGWLLTGAGQDEGVGGAQGCAPSLVGGVSDVARGKPLQRGVVHLLGVGEDVGGGSLGGGHTGDCSMAGVGWGEWRRTTEL